MRLAGDTAKALPLRLKFTVKSLASLRPPAEPDGRLWVYDTLTPGLAFVLTGRGAKSFYLYRRVQGRPSKVRLGGAELTVEQARDAVARLNGEIAKGVNVADKNRLNRNHANLGALWEAYRTEHVERRCSARTLIGFTSLWTTCLAQWKSRRLDITENDARSLHTRLGDERGHHTANRVIELIRAMYNWARIEPNPCRRGAITHFAETTRTRFLSPAEMQRLIAILDNEQVNPLVADIARLSLFTGARRQNVQSAKAGEFDLDSMTWTIPASKSKNGESMTLPLVPQAAEIVRRRIGGNSSNYLFPSRSKAGHVMEIKHGWDTIKTLAQLEDVHFHDCRRSFASWMAARGTSMAIIGKSLGHKHLSATQIYARLDLSAVRQHAAAAVDAMTRAGANEAK
jgi:integrase